LDGGGKEGEGEKISYGKSSKRRFIYLITEARGDLRRDLSSLERVIGRGTAREKSNNEK